MTRQSFDVDVQTIPDGPCVVALHATLQDESAAEFANLLCNLGRPDVIIVRLDEGQSLDVLDEDAMREHGWVRA